MQLSYVLTQPEAVEQSGKVGPEGGTVLGSIDDLKGGDYITLPTPPPQPTRSVPADTHMIHPPRT